MYIYIFLIIASIKIHANTNGRHLLQKLQFRSFLSKIEHMDAEYIKISPNDCDKILVYLKMAVSKKKWLIVNKKIK